MGETLEGSLTRRINLAAPKHVGDPANRTLRMWITDETRDRYKSIIRGDGWQTEDYAKNPVVLFGHDSASPPVARSLGFGFASENRPYKLARRAVPSGQGAFRRMFSDDQFATRDEYPFADIVYKLFTGGYMRATSVGFNPDETKRFETEDQLEEKEFADLTELQLGDTVYVRQSLLEHSAVPVPGNQNALVETLSTWIPALRSGLAATKEVLAAFRAVPVLRGWKSPDEIPVDEPSLDAHVKSFKALLEHVRTLMDAERHNPERTVVSLSISQEAAVAAAVDGWNRGKTDAEKREGFTCPKPFETHKACVAAMSDKDNIDDPDAFCAAWADHCGEKSVPTDLSEQRMGSKGGYEPDHDKDAAFGDGKKGLKPEEHQKAAAFHGRMADAHSSAASSKEHAAAADKSDGDEKKYHDKEAAYFGDKAKEHLAAAKTHAKDQGESEGEKENSDGKAAVPGSARKPAGTPGPGDDPAIGGDPSEDNGAPKTDPSKDGEDDEDDIEADLEQVKDAVGEGLQMIDEGVGMVQQAMALLDKHDEDLAALEPQNGEPSQLAAKKPPGFGALKRLMESLLDSAQRRIQARMLPCLDGMAKRSDLSTFMRDVDEIKERLGAIETRFASPASPAPKAPVPPKADGKPEQKGKPEIDRRAAQEHYRTVLDLTTSQNELARRLDAMRERPSSPAGGTPRPA